MNNLKKGSQFLVHFLLIAICVIWLLPTLGLMVSSFRPRGAISSSGWWEAFGGPMQFTLDNYSRLLTRQNLAQSFLNSLAIAIPSTVLPIAIAAFAAFAFAWMKSRLKEVVYGVVIVLLVVPIHVTLIPVLQLFTMLGINGTFFAVWLAHAAYGIPLAIIILRNFFSQLPASVLESGFMDGASHPVIFFRLVLPMALPALASLAIFQFMWVWNDLLVAMVFLGGTLDVAPLTVRIANLVNSYGGEWQVLTGAAFISMTLPLVVFFTMQKYFVQGMLAGSVKE